jgi:hypothetical protein
MTSGWLKTRAESSTAGPGGIQVSRLEDWSEAGREPALAEVLADPLVHVVMRRDGVTRAELEAVIRLGRSRLGLDPGWCGGTRSPASPKRGREAETAACL